MPQVPDNGFYLTKQDLQDLLTAAVKAATSTMSPLEQRRYDQEMKDEQRRGEMMKTLGKIEEESMRRKRDGCSHCRVPSGQKNAGGPAPKGTGEWCTGGQIHGYDTIGLICQRCGTVWLFKGTQNELQYAQDGGLLGMAPPPEERLISMA